MKNHFRYSLVLFAVVAVGSWLARHLGWYNAYWFTDIILHTTSGVALGLLWVALHRNIEQSRWILALGTVSFATFGSVLWEFWEYAGYLITRSSVPFYIPQLSDTLGDIVCGMGGGVLCVIIIMAVSRTKK
jgi:hypothetical protein